MWSHNIVVDNLQPSMLYVVPHAKERTIREPHRASPRNARHAHLADPSVGSATRPRHWPGHSHKTFGLPPRRDGFSLSSAASPRRTGLDPRGMEAFRQQPKGEVLPSDRNGQEAALTGTIAMEANGAGDRESDEARVRNRPMLFWRRKQRERDLDDEIRSHLRLEIEQRIERGESPEEARANAHRDFGNVGMVKEITRDMWRMAILDRLLQDLRHMVRYTWNTFRKQPASSTVTVLTLALVLAAITIVFGGMRALMFGNRPGAGNPQELVDFVNLADGNQPSEHLAYPIYAAYRDRTAVFSGIAAYTSFQMLRLRFGSSIQGVRMAGVTGNYFDVMGVKPSRGRALTLTDDTE